MKIIVLPRANGSRSRLLHLALAFPLGCLLCGPVLVRADTLLTCTGGSGSGSMDWADRGFYIPSYPGISLDSVGLKFSGYVAGSYVLSLTVRSNAYDGPLLGTASTSVSLNGSVSESKPATFVFPAVRIATNSRVCFILGVVSGPYPNVYYNIGGGCTQVVETDGTNAPLSTFRRYGVDIVVAGASSLQVVPGGIIQAAINAARPGETVSVAPGTYTEDITLRSDVNVIGSGYNTTILRGTGATNVVTANYVTNARFAGFQLPRGGTNSGYLGNSAVIIFGGNLMVENNRIMGHTNGLWIALGSSAIIRNNIIEGNGTPPVSQDGYGIVCASSTPLIANNLILSNLDIAMEIQGPAASGAQVINNTIVGNRRYAVYCQLSANPTIKNNIIAWNETGISGWNGAIPVSSYNDVWLNSAHNYDGSAVAGMGDLSADPRFNSASPQRFALAIGSPCIDAGDPAAAYNDPDGSRNDMGAYGGPGGVPPSLANGLGTGFLFNNIGKIPCSEITQSGSLAGLANVSASTSSNLYIYPFKDAPFGGYPWVYGLFGMDDTTVRYYQILGAKWVGNTAPALGAFQPVLDPLTKIKYTINTNGTVTATPISVGPDANGLYFRTDRADSGYWTYPDLKLILNSLRLENARYDFICKAFATNTLVSEVMLPTNQLSRITLWIDNNQVTVTNASVRDHLGNIIPDCGMIYVATSQENLQFEITAYHPTGFLESFTLSSLYGRNQNGGYVAADQYVGSHDSVSARPFWSGIGPGTQITNSLPAHLAGTLAPWQTCAYQFHLEAYARTIDGFNRVYGASFNDHYYINVGPSVGACLADLNNDGRVDGLDLAIFAARYGTNCAPGAPAAPAAPPATTTPAQPAAAAVK